MAMPGQAQVGEGVADGVAVVAALAMEAEFQEGVSFQ